MQAAKIAIRRSTLPTETTSHSCLEVPQIMGKRRKSFDELQMKEKRKDSVFIETIKKQKIGKFFLL